VTIGTRELFARHRLRCTSQRQALYETLRASTSHPSAEELYHLVRRRTDRLSLATVYNTLEALCEAGLARKLPTTNGSCRYDANMSDHLHLRLTNSTEIRDVPEALGARLMENLPRPVLAEIERAMGVRIDKVSIQLHGRDVDGT
jgi:Fe2+ or Zn2+ uptake regulation protein